MSEAEILRFADAIDGLTDDQLAVTLAALVHTLERRIGGQFTRQVVDALLSQRAAA